MAHSQAMFDLRLLRGLLAAGRPAAALTQPTPKSASTAAAAAASPSPEAAAALAARRKSDARLEGCLSECLDPIDWATYEPHLWANAARYQQRVALLFGALAPAPGSAAAGALGGAPGSAAAGVLGGAPAATAAAAAAAAAVEINALGVLAVAPRFQYLPISTPTVGATGAGGAGSRGGGLLRHSLSGGLAAGGGGFSPAGSPLSVGMAAGSPLAGGVGAFAFAAYQSVAGGAAGGGGFGGGCDLAADYSFADLGARWVAAKGALLFFIGVIRTPARAALAPWRLFCHLLQIVIKAMMNCGLWPS